MTELTRFAHDEHGHTYPDELGDYYLVDETQKLIATLREQLEGRWIPWKPGDALPRDGTYWVTRGPDQGWWTCEASLTNGEWPTGMTVHAYWSIPLPAPYSTTGGNNSGSHPPESEGAKCGTCGEHANEHGAINHEFTKGGGLSCEGSTEADDRADRATEETGADRPAAPISEQVTDERLGLWHQFAKPGVQGYAIGYDEYCALLQRLRSQPGEREALTDEQRDALTASAAHWDSVVVHGSSLAAALTRAGYARRADALLAMARERE